MILCVVQESDRWFQLADSISKLTLTTIKSGERHWDEEKPTVQQRQTPENGFVHSFVQTTETRKVYYLTSCYNLLTYDQ